MAGGDGSQALVASIASEHGIPFVSVGDLSRYRVELPPLSATPTSR
jgi:hypothetical protein